MSLLFSSYTRGSARTPVPENAASVAALRFKHTLATAENVSGNILDLGILPAGFRVVGATLISDDLDSDGSPAVVLDVGLMTGLPGEDLDENGDARTCGAELFSGATTAQAGGVAQSTLKAAYNIVATSEDRSVGVKVTTQSDVAVAGDIEVIVFVAA